MANQNFIHANKSLGQHFLSDSNLCSNIVKFAGNIKDSSIIEIGPGPGILTDAIVNASPKKIFAIDMDSRFVESTKKKYPNIEVIEGDGLQVKTWELGENPRIIISNLPYNVGTAMLVNWLNNIDSFSKMVLMFQKEVAERICAEPSTKDYGRLSIFSQLFCRTEIVMNVSKEYFTPQPKVDSAVVLFIPITNRINVNIKNLEKVTQVAFNQKRKMLHSALKSLKVNFDELNIDSKKRPEDLTIEEYCKIANSL